MTLPTRRRAAQPAVVTPELSTASTVTTPFGYTTQADAVPIAINAIISDLKSIGITL